MVIVKRVLILIIFFALGIVGSLQGILASHRLVFVFGIPLKGTLLSLWYVYNLILSVLIVVLLIIKKRLGWYLACFAVCLSIAHLGLNFIAITPASVETLFPGTGMTPVLYRWIHLIGLVINFVFLLLVLSARRIFFVSKKSTRENDGAENNGGVTASARL